MPQKNYEAVGRHLEAKSALHELATQRNASLRQLERLAGASARDSTLHITPDLDSAALLQLATRITQQHEALLAKLAELNAWATAADQPHTRLAPAWREHG